MNPRIVIVGGVAAGMSAATRARRLNERASITVLEKGGHVSFANCGLPYYVAGRIRSEDDLLVATPQKLRARYNIDVRTGHEVTRIDRGDKAVEVVDLGAGRSLMLPYDKLILATGASAIVPPIANANAPNVFVLRSMEDTRGLHAFLRDSGPRRAVIVGAGFIGLEMAEALHERGLAVTVVEKMPQVLPPLDAEMAAAVEAELGRNRVGLITGTGLKALHTSCGGGGGGGDDGAAVTHVELEDGRRLAADLVLLSIGVRPNIRLAAAAGLEIGHSGAVAVDEHLRTSDPDVYAVGDVAEVVHAVTGRPARIPLAGPANRLGRQAGEHAATGQSPRAPKVAGTAIVQLFNVVAAITGLSERAARQAGFDGDWAYVTANDHAGYYPGARAMRIKLVYERATGRVLGAQVVGGAGVDKRIDVIATCVHLGATIDDLAELDLAYAPQFGSAKDAVHQAAMTARNQRDGRMPAIDATRLNGQQLVDVRTAEEFARGSIDRAVNIPLDELRGRLGELDPGKPTVVFCQGGQRAYVAQRILIQGGFPAVVNLKGGYSLATVGATPDRRNPLTSPTRTAGCSLRRRPGGG
jgi:NADPH-dependent 2,4-dienoyl-CoA reductase/sulfur reductase-like enzyme/rhodanese-related sulfurtransferase